MFNLKYLAPLSASVIGAVLTFTPAAMAQNTGGIFSPVVNEGHASAQYRITVNPDTDQFAQRLHYQRAINGDFMWRGLIQTRKTSDSDFDLDFVQAELFWDMSDNDDRWRTGLRFDARIRSEGRPGLLGAHWTNQFKLSEDWTARFVVLSSINIGDNAADGIFLQTRGNVYTKLEQGPTIGLEFYNSYGSTDQFRDFEDQSHQIGPFVVYPVTDTWSIFTSALFGATEGTADQELRFRLSKSF